jgi:hypothetical protein
MAYWSYSRAKTHPEAAALVDGVAGRMKTSTQSL